MVVIKIDDVYRIEIDMQGNYILYRKYVTETGKNIGKESDEVLGYFTSVATALKGLLHEVTLSEEKTIELNEYIDFVEKTYQEVLLKLEGVGDRIGGKVRNYRKGSRK